MAGGWHHRDKLCDVLVGAAWVAAWALPRHLLEQVGYLAPLVISKQALLADGKLQPLRGAITARRELLGHAQNG